MSKSLRKAKISGRAQGLVNRSSLQHHYLSQDWLLLRARQFKDIAIPPDYEFFKANELRSKHSSKEPCHGDEYSTRESRKVSANQIADVELPKEFLRSSAGAYSLLVRRWEQLSLDYRHWKAQQELCDPTRDFADNATDDSERTGGITSEDGSVGVPRAEPCRPSLPQDPTFIVEPVYPNANHLDSLVDSQGRFPEESVSSGEEVKQRAKELDADIGLVDIDRSSHQRKFRRLRKATQELIRWIESLKPEKPLVYNTVTTTDGSRMNVPMKPYIPFPADEQPHPLINEEEVVDMVKNSYGARPAMTLRVAVRDMVNLPAELEKFDNLNYLQRRVVEEQIYRKPKKSSHVEDQPVRRGTKYSFIITEGPHNRKLSAVGTIYDAVTGERSRYGAWYLNRHMWKKMPVTEEISRPGTKESDENFLRITGQKLLRAVDTKTLGIGLVDGKECSSNLCDLYGAKKLCQTLKVRGQRVPVWMGNCG